MSVCVHVVFTCSVCLYEHVSICVSIYLLEYICVCLNIIMCVCLFEYTVYVYV